MKIDYDKFEVHFNTFYIDYLDKTFVDVQVQSIDCDTMVLHTEGWYGEYGGEDLVDLQSAVIKDTVIKYFEEIRNGTKIK
jgi:hypothetical protein